MIEITFYEKASAIIGFEIKGHAGYGESGQDIVCSAVSILGLNTANAMDTFTDDSFEAQMNEDGYLKLLCTEEVSDDTKLLLATFKLGIIGIYEQYGVDYIHYTIEEV